MPKNLPVRGDHTIATATPRTSDGTTAMRTSLADMARGTSPVNASSDKGASRKTPSPKPASPVSLHTKTPSPTLATLCTRTSNSARVGSPKGLPSERTSPTQGKLSPSTERTSPTQSKGSGSPTHGLAGARTIETKGARSASATACLTPMPPSYGTPRPLTARPSSTLIRSKSVTSSTGELLVASEAKARNSHRRPGVETRESSTQTMCDAGTQTFAAEEAAIAREIAAISEMAEIEGLGGDDDEAQTGWLDKHIRMQGELEMALRSGMELIAERVHSLPPQPFPPDGQPPVGTQRPGARHAGQRSTDAAVSRGTDHFSDGEGNEDDEVRSLSLSEDGPVIRRFLSAGSLNERSRRAPDPIAMLSDGQHKLRSNQLEPPQVAPLSIRRACSEPMTLAPNQGSEQGSDHSGATPNNSDRSGAMTEVALKRKDSNGQSRSANDCVGSDDGYSNVFEHLTPILSKMGVAQGHLEVVQENTAIVHEAHHERSDPVSGSVQVPATRVRALRCSTSVESLNLSEVHLRENGDTRAQGARSDISFGSASSAFTCLSSSTSGSHNLHPAFSPLAQARQSLTGTVSMPSLPQLQLR